MKRTLSTDAAKALAQAQGMTDLRKAILAKEAEGWNTVTLVAKDTGGGTYDVGLEAPKGVMVAYMLPEYVAEDVAVKGGEPADDLHITIVHLDHDAADLNMDDVRKLMALVSLVCTRHTDFSGELVGTGRFVNGEDTDPYWVGVDAPALVELQADLKQTLEANGFTLKPSADNYVPHVTVAHLPATMETPPLTYNPRNLWIPEICVCVGPTRFTFQLADREPEPYVAPGWAPEIVAKAVELDVESRFTLGPWYVPDRLDAHGEWSDAKELEKTFHSYINGQDKQIRKQHNLDVVAGEIVSGVVWPFEVTVPMTKADGTVTEHTFPAGTPFLGVHWTDDQAWQDVKDGKLAGYSIGGTARRMLVDLPEVTA